MREPTSISLWAIVINSKRSAWVHWETIRRTRRQAIHAYLELWSPEYRAAELREMGSSWQPRRVVVECPPK